MHIGRRYGDTQQQLTTNHAVIAVRMIGEDGAFVSPANVHARPIYLRSKLLRGQETIHFARRGTAGKRDAEFSFASYSLPGPVHKAAGGGAGDLRGIAADVDARKNFFGQ